MTNMINMNNSAPKTVKSHDHKMAVCHVSHIRSLIGLLSTDVPF